MLAFSEVANEAPRHHLPSADRQSHEIELEVFLKHICQHFFKGNPTWFIFRSVSWIVYSSRMIFSKIGWVIWSFGIQNLLLRTFSRILYTIFFLFIQASDGLDSALVDMELSSRLQNCSTSISDKVKEYFNIMVENSYFKIISGGKASSCHINTHIAGILLIKRGPKY